jgi:serine palmitoyltransferase
VWVALRIIMGEDGTGLGASKLRRLRDNANFVRARLEAMGLHVYGDYNSPVIPVMLYMPGKIAAFSRECYRRGLAVVVVGFPATSLLMSRTRICISAGHR